MAPEGATMLSVGFTVSITIESLVVPRFPVRSDICAFRMSE